MNKSSFYKWFWIIPGGGVFGFFVIGFVKNRIKDFSRTKYYVNVIYIVALIMLFIFVLKGVGYIFGEGFDTISNYILDIYGLFIVNLIFYKYYNKYVKNSIETNNQETI